MRAFNARPQLGTCSFLPSIALIAYGDTHKVKDHEGPKGADNGNVEDVAAQRPKLSEYEDVSSSLNGA